MVTGEFASVAETLVNTIILLDVLLTLSGKWGVILHSGNLKEVACEIAHR